MKARFRTARRHAGIARAGFSLIEVALALGIFAFTIISTVGLMGVGLNVASDSMQSTAIQLLRLRVEASIRQIDFDTVASEGFVKDYWCASDGRPLEPTDSHFERDAVFRARVAASVLSGVGEPLGWKQGGDTSSSKESLTSVSITISYAPGGAVLPQAPGKIGFLIIARN